MRSEESGYASGESSHESLVEVYFSKPHLKFINAQLQKLEPQGEKRHRSHFDLSNMTRHIEMVHRNSTGLVPNYSLRSHRPRYC